MTPLAPKSFRQPPTSHRALAPLRFPTYRWLHVTLLPALLCVGLWLASSALFAAWAAALEYGLVLLGQHGVLVARPVEWATVLQGQLLVADIPAASPSSDQLLVGWLIAAAMALASVAVGAERAPLRYLLRAFLLCHLASLVFFGLLDGQLPYSLGDHVAAGVTINWMLMLLVPWLHAATFHIFGFGLWRKVALSLTTLLALAVLAPVQYLFHITVIQPWSLLQLPVLYLFAGLLLDVMVFVSLYAWAMSWRAVEERG